MSNIRIESVELPAGAAVVELAVHIMARAESMGLFAPEEPVRVLDQEVLTRVWRALARAGVAREATAGLLAGAALEDGGGRGLLEEVYRALEACPTPEHEWKQLLQVLPVETLAALTDISMSSLRRYAAESGAAEHRATPDDVAARLHCLALIVDALAGSYNAYGIRRWFERSFPQLEGCSPRQLLVGAWSPEDPGPARVRSFAEELPSLTAA